VLGSKSSFETVAFLSPVRSVRGKLIDSTAVGVQTNMRNKTRQTIRKTKGKTIAGGEERQLNSIHFTPPLHSLSSSLDLLLLLSVHLRSLYRIELM